MLDASRPWLVYWILHALELLGSPPLDRFSSVIDTLRRCQDASGGFGGGPGQSPHTAPTYASMLSLATVGSAEALGVVDRPALYRFFMRLKSPSGGFHVQDDGEMDTRGLYTVLAVASLARLLHTMEARYTISKRCCYPVFTHTCFFSTLPAARAQTFNTSRRCACLRQHSG